MDYQDKNIKCKDCGEDFVFTAGEQAFYAQKGFENSPARCVPCRNQRRDQFKKPGGARQKQLYDDVCDACQRAIQVPFKRTGTKPVYCLECREKENARMV